MLFLIRWYWYWMLSHSQSHASVGFAYQDIFQHARTGTEQDEPLRHTLGLTFHQPDHSGRDDQLRLWQDRVGGGVNIVHRLHFEDIAKCIDQSDVGEALHIPSLETVQVLLWCVAFLGFLYRKLSGFTANLRASFANLPSSSETEVSLTSSTPKCHGTPIAKLVCTSNML